MKLYNPQTIPPSLPAENYPVKASYKNAAFLWKTNVHVDVLCAQNETLSNTALETLFLKNKFSAQNGSVLFSHLCSALFSDYQPTAVTHFINLELLIAHE